MSISAKAVKDLTRQMTSFRHSAEVKAVLTEIAEEEGIELDPQKLRDAVRMVNAGRIEGTAQAALEEALGDMGIKIGKASKKKEEPEEAEAEDAEEADDAEEAEEAEEADE